VERIIGVPPEEIMRANGIYYINSGIEEGTLTTITQDVILKHMDMSWGDNDITVFVNSPGGNLSEGWMLIDILDFIRLDVRTYGVGFCASLGAMILAAGTPGKRYCMPNTTIMTHLPSFYGLEGNVHQLGPEMKHVNIEYKRAIEFWKKHSNCKTEKQVVAKLIGSKDNYMTPEEALKLGIIDNILPDKYVKK